jgi:hypothetical protein
MPMIASAASGKFRRENALNQAAIAIGLAVG